MATMTSQGTLPASGAAMDAVPLTNTINHIMSTFNGTNIDDTNVDSTSADGIATLANTQTISGNKTFSGTTAFTGSVTGISGFADATAGASGADYATIQAADDALDAAAGYILRVFGSQTYSETVTVSTNDNVIYVDPLTVITSLVLSGDRNTVIMGASCQFTGNVILSGNHNVLKMGVLANLDGDVTLSGTACELHLGAGSNLATTKTMLLSGANSKCIAGNEATWPGIISMTADDTYLELGNQSVVTGVTGLVTGTGQVLRCGNEVQLIGNITQSAVDSEIHMGSTANIDGTVALSGATSRFILGASANLAQTLAITGAQVLAEVGHASTITGAVSFDVIGHSHLKIGHNSTLSSTLTVGNSGYGGSQTVDIGNSVQIVGNITISSQGNTINVGAFWDFDGTINIDANGDQCHMTLGANGNLASTFTSLGDATDLYIGTGSTMTAAVLFDTANYLTMRTGGNVAFSSTSTFDGNNSQVNHGPSNTFAGAVVLSGWNTAYNFGPAADLNSTLTIGTGGANSVTLGPASTIAGAVSVTGVDCTLIAGASADFDGIVTLSGAGCSLICENGCDLDGIVASGASFLIDGGGHDTLVNGTTANHAISVTAANGTIKNTGVQTTSGGGSEFDCVSSSAGGSYLTIQNVIVRASDDEGFHLIGDFAKIMYCEFLNVSDGDWILFGGDRYRIVGCHFGSGTSGNTVKADAEGDKGIIVANLAEDTNSTFNLLAGADNSLIVGNITDYGVVDSSTSSTVANNEEY